MEACTSPNTRWAVIEHLQNQLFAQTSEYFDVLAERAPGSYRAEVLEHAISLALSPARTTSEKSFLAHDVWRNARFVFTRAQQRYEAVIQKYGNDPASPLNSYHGNMIDETLVEIDLKTAIYKALTSADPKLIVYYESMINEESVHESAQALGVSCSTVSRARAKIRDLASPVVKAYQEL